MFLHVFALFHTPKIVCIAISIDYILFTNNKTLFLLFNFKTLIIFDKKNTIASFLLISRLKKSDGN